jgi:hypothetical protein
MDRRASAFRAKLLRRELFSRGSREHGIPPMRYRKAMKCLLLSALIAVFMTPPALAQMGMGNPPAMTAGAISKAAPGTKLTFVMRIDTIKRAQASGPVLDPVSGRTYHVSSSVLTVHMASDMPVIMGSRDELKPGAIVYVYGVATKAKAADATKVVVVTPYVRTR